MKINGIVIALALAGCSASGDRVQPLPATAEAPYRLGAGDEVRVTVYGLDAATNNYVVGDGGTIAVPLVGPVVATGKTADELQEGLVAAIKARELVRVPSVSVQVQKYRPFFILGEVQKPGQYPYVPRMSVLTAVSIAGGYTFRANTKTATIVRTEGASTVKGSALPESLVQPGDTIKIAEAWF
jgi:polysaccharide export outer membrane protein